MGLRGKSGLTLFSVPIDEIHHIFAFSNTETMRQVEDSLAESPMRNAARCL